MANDFPFLVRYEGDGDWSSPSRYWQRLQDKDFVIGRLYRLCVVEERNMERHKACFAELNEIWRNLPDYMLEEYPSVEHLRKKGLIACGFAKEHLYVYSSQREARKHAAFIRPLIDSYAIVVVKGKALRIFEAKSQSLRSMGKAVFNESMDAVLHWASSLIGTDRQTVSQYARETA